MSNLFNLHAPEMFYRDNFIISMTIIIDDYYRPIEKNILFTFRKNKEDDKSNRCTRAST